MPRKPKPPTEKMIARAKVLRARELAERRRKHDANPYRRKDLIHIHRDLTDDLAIRIDWQAVHGLYRHLGLRDVRLDILLYPETQSLVSLADARYRSGQWHAGPRVAEVKLSQFALANHSAKWAEDLIQRAILHELRHAHQEDHWDRELLKSENQQKKYSERLNELDAYEFENSKEWQIVSVRRLGPLKRGARAVRRMLK